MAFPIDSLRKRLVEFKRHFSSSISNSKAKTYRLIAAEQLVVSSGTAWEHYFHQNFLLQAKRAYATFAARKEAAMSQSIEERYGKVARTRTKIQFQKKISLHDLENLLNPSGYNIVPPEKDFAKIAQDLLPSDAQKYSLNAEMDQFRIYFKALRNHIAHRSKKSNDDLVHAIAKLEHPGNMRLIGTIVPWNGYLPGGQAGVLRAIEVVNKLESLATSIS